VNVAANLTLRPAGTLFGVPPAVSAKGSEIAVLGIPFDMGTHPSRIGARSGPAHVRAHSALVAEAAEDLGVDPIRALDIVDLGDIDVQPARVGSAYPLITAAIGEIIDVGATPVTIGGDGAVALPQMRALAQRHDDLVVVHFDAHTDAYGPTDPDVYNNANPFVHSARERLIDVGSSFHVGVRDTQLAGRPGAVGYASELGYRVITLDAIRATGVPQVLDEIDASIRGRPMYLCWDMDVFGPSISPGVVTPRGLISRQPVSKPPKMVWPRRAASESSRIPPTTCGFRSAHAWADGRSVKKLR
jgi:arginase family enzyme